MRLIRALRKRQGSRPMAEAALPVDLLNPGQVFACLGVMEVAEILIGQAEAVFDWSDGAGDAKFRLAAAGAESPVERVMRFLEEAALITTMPAQSENASKWKTPWGDDPEPAAPDHSFPFPDPDSPEKLPAVLRDHAGNEIAIDYWGDSTSRDNVKFWTGPGGYPGSAILRNALHSVRGQIRQHASKPFALSAPQSNSFRFDWRRDYIPGNIGFSPNQHTGISMVGFPLVEILAAIGVTNARPARIHKLEYRYGVLGGARFLDPILVRAALGAEALPIPGLPFRQFTMRMGWPGKEGQARCITEVAETEPQQEHHS